MNEPRKDQTLKIDEPEKDGIALLFSGGLDTTIEVIERLKTHRVAHLLTFNNGYCINLGGAARRVESLRKKFGAGRIEHRFVDTAPLRALLQTKHKAFLDRFRSPLVFDLACKMASVVSLIHYAKTRGIHDISDGASHEQNEIFLQVPLFTDHIKPNVTEYGLCFLRPVAFDQSREMKKNRLIAEGLDAGTMALEKIYIGSNIVHQPFCLRGIMTFFFTSPTRRLSLVRQFALSTEQAMEAWDELWPTAKEHLDGLLGS